MRYCWLYLAGVLGTGYPGTVKPGARGVASAEIPQRGSPFSTCHLEQFSTRPSRRSCHRGLRYAGNLGRSNKCLAGSSVHARSILISFGLVANPQIGGGWILCSAATNRPSSDSSGLSNHAYLLTSRISLTGITALDVAQTRRSCGRI